MGSAGALVCRTSGGRVFLVTFSRPIRTRLTYAAPPALDLRADQISRLRDRIDDAAVLVKGGGKAAALQRFLAGRSWSLAEPSLRDERFSGTGH
jgi:hypothetical protein